MEQLSEEITIPSGQYKIKADNECNFVFEIPVSTLNPTSMGTYSI